MPKLSYAFIIVVVIACYILKYDMFNGFVLSGIFIASWNAISDMKSLFGFVSTKKHNREVSAAKIKGQDAVFSVYLFDKPQFQKHLNLYMEKKGLEFSSKNKPRKKETIAGWREVLGVSKDADVNAVNLAYKELVKRHHPDVNKEPGNNDRLIQINLAKEAADKFFM